MRGRRAFLFFVEAVPRVAISLPREIQEALDLHDATPDPGAFAMAIFRKLSGPLRTIHNRAAARSKIRAIQVNDGPRRKRIVLQSPRNDTPAQLAARFAALVTRRPDLVADETRRWALGLPRGLDGAEPLDERVAAAAIPRRLFGIDDVIIIGVVVPLLIAIIPTVLPMIMSWGADAVASIGGAAPGAPVTEEPGGAEESADWFGFAPEHVMIAAAAVVVVIALK